MLAALGGILSERVGVFNIAPEGIMPFCAFFAIYGSYVLGSAMLGALFAALICGAIDFIFVELV